MNKKIRFLIPKHYRGRDCFSDLPRPTGFYPKVRILVLLALCLTFGLVHANLGFAVQATGAANERLDSETIKKLTVASTQHNLILLLIESGKYDKVEAEWKKVLDLKLSNKYEDAVALSMETIANKLSDAKQLPLAQRILDLGLAGMNFNNKNRADILRLKAYFFKEGGDLEKAIETYREANELLEKP